MSRGRRRHKRKKISTAVYISSCLALSARYVLLVVVDQDAYCLHVYDVALDIAVRKAHKGDLKIQSKKYLRMCHVGGSRVVFTVAGQRLKMVDLDTMEVTLTFQGQYYDTLQSAPIFLKNTSELLTITKNGHHLQVFCLRTGKVTRIIYQDVQHSSSLSICRRLVTNEAGTLAAFKGFLKSPRHFFVFDLTRSQMLCSVDCQSLAPARYSLALHFMLAGITDDGLILFDGAYRGEESSSSAGGSGGGGDADADDGGVSGGGGGGQEVEKGEDGKASLKDAGEPCADCMIVFDVFRGHVVRHLPGKNDNSKDVYPSYFNCCHMLDQTSLLVELDEGGAIAYNFRTGEQRAAIDKDVMTVDWRFKDNCPIVVSRDNVGRPWTFRVRTKRDLLFVANFFPDELISQVTGRVVLLPGHGADFLVPPETGDTPVLFHLQGQGLEALLGDQTPLGAYPELFQDLKLDLTVTDLDTDKENNKADDPGTDDK